MNHVEEDIFEVIHTVAVLHARLVSSMGALDALHALQGFSHREHDKARTNVNVDNAMMMSKVGVVMLKLGPKCASSC